MKTKKSDKDVRIELRGIHHTYFNKYYTDDELFKDYWNIEYRKKPEDINWFQKNFNNDWKPLLYSSEITGIFNPLQIYNKEDFFKLKGMIQTLEDYKNYMNEQKEHQLATELKIKKNSEDLY